MQKDPKGQPCLSGSLASEELKTLPGHGDFVAKNIAETVLNAIHLSDLDPSALGLSEAVQDYCENPGAVLGPGPMALGELFFGSDFHKSKFEDVRRCVNNLCRDAEISFKDVTITPGQLTGPEMQSLWCKLKGAIDDYCAQRLGKHLRMGRPVAQ